MEKNVEDAVNAFKEGKPILLYDSNFRESETDMLFPAIYSTPECIRKLRHECGGLLFLAISHEIAEKFGMPFIEDVYSKVGHEFPLIAKMDARDIRYDKRSAFALSINERTTFTGITDADRNTTVKRFAEIAEECKDKSHEEAMEILGKNFRSPGHIPVCRESKGGLSTRQGHTELAVAMARLANLPACTIGAEMLEPNGDRALKLEDARAYAKKHNIPMLEGKDVLEALHIHLESENGNAEAEEPATKKHKDNQ